MVGQPQGAPQARRQDQQLGINVRAGHTEAFNTNLMKLAVTAFLWPLMPEHRTGVPKPPGLIKEQPMLFRCTHAPGRTFGPQSKAIAVAVFKGIHLFFNDVSDFTDRSFEQLGMFDHGHTDFLIAVLSENLSNGGFNVLPDRCLVRENIVHPPDCLNLCQNNILIGF